MAADHTERRIQLGPRRPIESAELASALDDHLRPSSRPTFEPIGTTLTKGSPIAPWAVTVPVGVPAVRQRRHCPRIFTTPRDYVIAFVRSDSRPSQDQLAEWQRAGPEGPPALPPLLAIVDGDEEQALKIAESHPHIEVIADPSGAIADKFGVRIWPTIVGVSDGMITGVRHGLVEFEPPEQVSRDDNASMAHTSSSDQAAP